MDELMPEYDRTPSNSTAYAFAPGLMTENKYVTGIVAVWPAFTKNALPSDDMITLLTGAEYDNVRL